jgi:phage baseplate assembly protein W
MAIEKKYVDIDLSLKKGSRNDVRKKINTEAINQHLKLLVLTEQDDIPFLNNISADLRGLLFEPYTVHIQNTINDVVRMIVSQYESRVTLDDVQNSMDGNDLTVTISYTINQTRVVGQFKTILKRDH